MVPLIQSCEADKETDKLMELLYKRIQPMRVYS